MYVSFGPSGNRHKDKIKNANIFLEVKPTKDKRGEGTGVGRGSLQTMMWVLNICERRGESEEDWVGRSSDVSATLRKSHLAQGRGIDNDYLVEGSFAGQNFQVLSLPLCQESIALTQMLKWIAQALWLGAVSYPDSLPQVLL